MVEANLGHLQKDTEATATKVVVKQFVEVQLADGKIGGVLVDKSTIPEAGEFCFAQEFHATILPDQTVFERGVARIKEWLLSPDVPRFRTIPRSETSMLQ